MSQDLEPKTVVTKEKAEQLRNITGCGLIQCKRALEATNGNIERAIEFLRFDGIALVIKKV